MHSSRTIVSRIPAFAGMTRRSVTASSRPSCASLTTRHRRVIYDRSAHSRHLCAGTLNSGAARVTTEALSPSPSPAATATRAIAWWLLACAAMVFAMAVIGAITRLTGSGLSMVEWRPLIGALPPLERGGVAAGLRSVPGDAGIPEDQCRHGPRRLQADLLLGVVPPAVGPVHRPRLRPALRLVLADRAHRPAAAAAVGGAVLVLGGLQGLLGWFMVKSGLVDRPSVSHYRLAAHLGLAVLIYGLLMWQAWILLGTATAVSASRPAPPYAWRRWRWSHSPCCGARSSQGWMPAWPTTRSRLWTAISCRRKPGT